MKKGQVITEIPKPTGQAMDINQIAGLMNQKEEKTFDSAFYDVIKALSTEDKQRLFSELSENQIKIITKLQSIDDLTKKKDKYLYTPICHHFIVLMASKNRESRKEVLRAIKNAHPEQKFDQGTERLKQLLG
jgi:translation initiation factor RLI1